MDYFPDKDIAEDEKWRPHGYLNATDNNIDEITQEIPLVPENIELGEDTPPEDNLPVEDLNLKQVTDPINEDSTPEPVTRRHFIKNTAIVAGVVILGLKACGTRDISTTNVSIPQPPSTINSLPTTVSTIIPPTSNLFPTTTFPRPTVPENISSLPGYIRHGFIDKPLIALTVDDWTDRRHDPLRLSQLLDTAKQKKIGLTFFPTGEALQYFFDTGQSDIWRRAVDEGHVIGNHTWSHFQAVNPGQKNFDDLDPSVRDRELDRTQDILDKVLGPRKEFKMYLMRPPGGHGGGVLYPEPKAPLLPKPRNQALVQNMNDKGMSMVMWTIEQNGVGDDQPYTDKIMGSGPESVKNGSIILFHPPHFRMSLYGPLIDRLRHERGLEPVTVPGLFA